LDDSSSHSNGNSLRAAASSELSHDVLDVPLYRLIRNKETLSDIAVSDLLKNLDFASAQCFMAEMLGEVSYHFGLPAVLYQ
jgi:hypothetical protein